MKNQIMFELSKIYGTPFYVYDFFKLKSSYKELNSIFSPLAKIFYSIKANPSLAICHEFQNLGSGAEVCSLIELETALKSGFLAENIIAVGPAKSENFLRRCLEMKIYCVVCESFSELDLIKKIAFDLSIIAPIAIRINPNFLVKNALLKMGGQSSQFGIDESILLSHFSHFLDKNIQLRGIHIYNGTRILDAKLLSENIINILVLAEKLMKDFNLNFEMIDLGGGFGIPYFSDEKYLDTQLLKKLVPPILKDFFSKYPKIKLIVESGRFLIAPAGFFITKILGSDTN